MMKSLQARDLSLLTAIISGRFRQARVCREAIGFHTQMFEIGISDSDLKTRNSAVPARHV